MDSPEFLSPDLKKRGSKGRSASMSDVRRKCTDGKARRCAFKRARTATDMSLLHANYS